MRAAPLGVLSRHGLYVPGGGGTGPLWTPASVTNVKLWLRADLGVTIATGVSQWADQSGAGNHFTQVSGSRQPTVTSNAINGRRALSFANATARKLACASFAGPSTDLEAWFVARVTSVNFSVWDQTPTNIASGYLYADGHSYDNTGTTARKAASPQLASLGSWHVFSVKSAAGAWSCYVNGALEFTTASNTFASPTSFAIGDRVGDGNAMDGQVAEVGLARIMSSGDRALLKSYLTSWFGISLASDWT